MIKGEKEIDQELIWLSTVSLIDLYAQILVFKF